MLLRATEIVMERDGFHRATTNKIAEVAGVSIGTLYHYFPTKESLVEAMVHRMWEAELRSLEERATILEDAPLERAVEAIVDGLVAVVAHRRGLWKRWYGEASHLGNLELGLDMTDRGVALVRAALERHRPRVRPNDLGFAADLVVKTALAVVRTAARDYPAQLETGALARELTDMIVRYLLR